MSGDMTGNKPWRMKRTKEKKKNKGFLYELFEDEQREK
jgi:hypothetical protein